MTDVQLGLLAF